MNLCLGSLVMMVGTIYEVQQRSERAGSYEWFFCEQRSQKSVGPLFFWSCKYSCILPFRRLIEPRSKHSAVACA